MIAEDGFEKIGINAVAARSGVSKILIYRYFGSVEGLMAAYMQQHDFWLNFPLEFPDCNELPAFIKSIFQQYINQLRNDATLRRLYRWELSCNNEITTKLREQREKVGINLVERTSEITGIPLKKIEVMASMISASITYLAMLGDFCPVYNNIPIDKDTGWEQINEGIDSLIGKYLESKNDIE